MTRLVFIAIIALLLILGFLGIVFLKDAYKLLPISASKDFTPSPFSEWHDFVAPSGKFKAMFPTFPQHATQTVKDPKTNQIRHYDMYVAEKSNGTTFMVNLISFPDGIESPEIIQKTVVNDLLASNSANQLKNMQIGAYKNYRTLNFAISNPDMIIEGMSFVDGNTLYLLSTVSPNTTYNPQEYEYFVKSFDLLSVQ